MLFLNGCENLSKKKKNKFIKSLEGPKKIKEIGERLLLILNKHEDFRKSQLLGHFYSALVNEDISLDDFFRASAAVSQTYFEDILKIDEVFTGLSANGYQLGVKQSVIQSFVISGLYIEKITIRDRNDIFFENTMNNQNSNYSLSKNYSITELGLKFKEQINSFTEKNVNFMK